MSVEPTATTLRTAGTPASHGVVAASGPLTRFLVKVMVALELRRARKLVAEMDDRMLRDIGMVRSDAERFIRFGRDGAPPVSPWWNQ